jgi:hypothetical protein
MYCAMDIPKLPTTSKTRPRVSAVPTAIRALQVKAATSSATAIDTAEGTHRSGVAKRYARGSSKSNTGRKSLMKKQNA